MSDAPIMDPMEMLVAEALARAGVRFEHDFSGKTKGLDFFLPEHDIFIEVKRFHSDRIGEQMSRAENVIAVQGKAAVEFLAVALGRADLAQVAFIRDPEHSERMPTAYAR
jgi:hypothetical protein